ncbi:MAG TPA: hypothetical protein VIV14_01905 [Gammaproteobacteria bacterium]
MRRGTILATAASFVVVAVVATSILVSGLPNEQRAMRADRQRLADIRAIAVAVDRHWAELGQLPPDLDAVATPRRLRRLPVDPVDGSVYEYLVLGDADYSLCASFDRETRDPALRRFWQHGAGRRCFSFNAAATVLP